MQVIHTPCDAPFGLTPQSLRPRKSPQAVQVLAIADATGSSGPFARGITHILQALATSLPAARVPRRRGRRRDPFLERA